MGGGRGGGLGPQPHTEPNIACLPVWRGDRAYPIQRELKGADLPVATGVGSAALGRGVVCVTGVSVPGPGHPGHPRLCVVWARRGHACTSGHQMGVQASSSVWALMGVHVSTCVDVPGLMRVSSFECRAGDGPGSVPDSAVVSISLGHRRRGGKNVFTRGGGRGHGLALGFC